MKVAVVGAGISGLTAAYLLSKAHDVTVFEKDDRIGGHTATKHVRWRGRNYDIDTGFIVFNDRTYPNFQRLMDTLKVPYQKTEMSFSVTCERTGLEYNGSHLDGLFAQRHNAVTPSFWWMLKDIVRFNKACQRDVAAGHITDTTTLGEYLKSNGYGERFLNQYLLPMGAAIWSSSPADIYDFPLLFFVRFFKNHGLLDLINRPQWYVIQGGSNQYLKPLTKRFEDRIVCCAGIQGIRRTDGQVFIRREDREEAFDRVVMACHSDQALALLDDPSDAEQQILSAIAYRSNDVVLHTDDSQLPALKRAWASWNYRIKGEDSSPPVLTYNMNILQGLQAEDTFCVTLNDTDNIDPDRVLGQFEYSHPVFNQKSLAAARRWQEISGDQTWYCGAYWANGFHEDGCRSAFRVADALGVEW